MTLQRLGTSLERAAQESFDDPGDSGEARIAGQSMMVAVVDLLPDNSGFETGKRQIKRHVTPVAPGLPGIALENFRAAQASGAGRRPPANFLPFARVVRVHPIRA